MNITLIPNWRNKTLKCYYCDSTESVKYETDILIPVADKYFISEKICVCNACALKYILKKGIIMSKEEMISFIKEFPYIHISHFLFADYEFIYSDTNGIIYDEFGNIFEDWHSPNDIRGRNGIRERISSQWQDGWYIKE